MPALPRNADIAQQGGNVRFVPKADIVRCGDSRTRAVTAPSLPAAVVGRGKRLRTDCALNFCKRFFTGDVVTGFIGSACPRHAVADLLNCLRRHSTDLLLSSRHGAWRRLNMPDSYSRLLWRAGTGGRSGI